MKCDLLSIDEAASIPLTTLENLIQTIGLSCPILLSTTTSGYEGTGNVFAIRFLSKLESSGRCVVRHTINDPVRYAKNDPIELWLNQAILCSNSIDETRDELKKYPIPSQLEFSIGNKNVLFNGDHDQLLFSIMKIFIQSHYRHSPNDIQIMADLSTHHIFVLHETESNNNNNVFCVAQVAIEDSAEMDDCHSAGNLIPSVLLTNFPDVEVGKGVRIVRIATRLGAQSMGYGREMVKRICEFYALRRNEGILEEKGRNLF